ncbi:uncharacterized protein LOC108732535 isoform X3 [Agrilus planipennis]|uniref:Uncharacterized protein LOC108732535 isoform X1 n=1 Tax=Agrilus planipennis TaxID=224129 RepID=A0A7F5RDT2_AGRPL|nr:uncharacterized protein LOC108732535 isoform X1 [Agrilus planipennis]XP_025834137.1 uncharacterized protein LOC108732535 isoform X2 [Agrilus planipennis]XP_025834138.1 uncharacterized protein LOC108732535 isoform X3 [Agrilus planipennis]
MFRQFIAIVVLALISFTYSQYTSRGQCSDRTNLRAVQNFSFARYASNNASWYPIYTYVNSDCQIVNFALTDNVTMDMVYIQKNLTTGVWFGRRGVVTWVPGSRREGVLSLVYPDVRDPLIFRILGIDYVNYTIDYRCINLDSSNKREFLYIMSRRNTLSAALNATVQRIVRANGLGGIQQMHVVQDARSCTR